MTVNMILSQLAGLTISDLVTFCDAINADVNSTARCLSRLVDGRPMYILTKHPENNIDNKIKVIKEIRDAGGGNITLKESKEISEGTRTMYVGNLSPLGWAELEKKLNDYGWEINPTTAPKNRID